MARDWVKLHTSMLGHVGTMRLSDGAFRLWVVLLMMAGQADDDGRAASWDDLTFYLRWTDDDLTAALAELNGRAAVRDGAVFVRDWDDWQPKIDRTNAERQARYRDRHVTALRNGVTNAPTRAREEETEPEETVEPEEPEEQQPCDAEAPRWAPVVHWAHRRLGRDNCIGAKGQQLAWVGRLCGIVGPPARDDPRKAVTLLEQFYEDQKRTKGWPSITPRNVNERVVKWLAERDNAPDFAAFVQT